jgi:Ni,Fe-hydrogenase III large subunit
MDIGLVGMAARASGCVQDIRQDHAFGYYQSAKIPVATFDTGDVFARTHVRWKEVQHSAEYISQLLTAIKVNPKSSRETTVSESAQLVSKDSLALSLVEGWRGEICHVAITDSEGKFKKYKVVDPSFHNWFGLALALREQEISDFPLCNKSFNLSYCGHDL